MNPKHEYILGGFLGGTLLIVFLFMFCDASYEKGRIEGMSGIRSEAIRLGFARVENGSFIWKTDAEKNTP